MARRTLSVFEAVGVIGMALAVVTHQSNALTAVPRTATAATPQTQPGPVDTVRLEPIDRNFTYGPSLAERNLRAVSAATASIVVTYDAGFAGNTQAQAAFQAAANIWGTVVSSPVPIRVNASFRDLGDPLLLGQAGPTFVCTSAFGQTNTWYANALADKLAGADACGVGSAEISASFNSGNTAWEFGVGGVPVPGKVSFLTVVLHELAHGLGFLGSMTSSGSVGSWGRDGRPDIYDRFAFTASGTPAWLLNFPSPSFALGAELVGGKIYFGGDKAIAANGGGSPKLESSLQPFSQGSSYSHLDDVLYTGTPNGLMTYQLARAEVYTDPGPIVRGVFADEGWTIPTPTLTPPGAPSAFTTSAVGTSVTMTWRAPTTGDAPTTYYIASGSSSGRSDLANFSTGSTATSFSADRVGLGTYYVRVRAVNAAGTSAESNESILVVGGGSNPSGVPGVPTAFVTSAFGTTVTMTWRAPTTGGTPTTYYIASGSSSGLSDLAYFSTGSTATSFSADRVGLGTYYVRVRAANAVGTSAESNESILVVGSNSNQPGAPVAFTATAVGTAVTMTWRAPQTGGAPTSYLIESGSSSGLSDIASIPLGSTATLFFAQNVGRGTYYVRLRAVNAFGSGPVSNEVVLVVR